MSLIALLVGGAALVAIAGFWMLVLTEGAYAGPRMVRWLYERGAATYDDVKRFQPAEELEFLGRPLADRLADPDGQAGMVLDVATGTGRLPATLLGAASFAGDVIGVDTSAAMLARAAAKAFAGRERAHYLLASADPLPFADDSFEAVTMLEALEFVPDRDRALAEMARVLAPGGWLFVSNRCGLDALLFPGRVDGREAFARRLRRHGLVDVRAAPWQTYYELYWARRPGTRAKPSSSRTWWSSLRCRRCRAVGAWVVSDVGLECRACGAGWFLHEGVWQQVGDQPT